MLNASVCSRVSSTSPLLPLQSHPLFVSQVLEYLAELVVNGSSHPGAVGPEPATLVPSAPRAPVGPPPAGWRDVLVKEGPEGWARAVRAHKGVLLTDTTMCEHWPVAAISPYIRTAGIQSR